LAAIAIACLSSLKGVAAAASTGKVFELHYQMKRKKICHPRRPTTKKQRRRRQQQELDIIVNASLSGGGGSGCCKGQACCLLPRKVCKLDFPFWF